ncbi:MAG TPA: MerR family transcriptional regulator, partial [Candidatus Binatia bacterium]|nr:MerR family transcriptional regulator [Candidatus Binatia bacterium]
MPTEQGYTLQDLVDLSGVTPRTVRYYIAQGLLPSPEGAGPAARYTEGHLARLRLIRQLQREHLPLAEIRTRLVGLDDDAISTLVDTEPSPPNDSAIDYIRSVLAGQGTTVRARTTAPPVPRVHGSLLKRIATPLEPSAALELAPPAPRPMASMAVPDLVEPGAPEPPTPPPDRSQWDRIGLTPNIELHVRRPLSRVQNKQV